MLRLIPRPSTAPMQQQGSVPSVSTKAKPATGLGVAPSALVYTLLRHGRGLSHQEAERRLLESLDGPFQAA